MSNTRTFPLRKILTLNAALPGLDGHIEEVTTEAKGSEKTTSRKVTPFKFGKDGKGGKVRWNIGKNKTILQAEADQFSKNKDKLISDLSNGGISIEADDTEAIAKLNKELESMLDVEIEVSGLLDISLDDLNLDDNPQLSPSVLSALSDLIKE